MKYYLSVIVVFLFLGVSAYVGFYFLGIKKFNNIVSSPVAINTDFTYFSQLTGLGVMSPEEVTPAVVAVMVDNHPDARPQVGLDKAAIVYEAPAEGGINRFLAIFPLTQTVEKVGPVRSARPYFLDWQAEYGKTLYLHCGGSAEALVEIKKRGVLDGDEFFNGAYYWRDNGRTAPHNLFTSSELWQRLWQARNVSTTPWAGWNFSVEVPTSTASARAITIKYDTDYIVNWSFDNGRDIYLRSMNDVPHKMSGGDEALSADNVILQYVQIRTLDDYGRQGVTTVGSGDARVLRDGKLWRGTWKKDAIEARTKFFDVNGQEIKLKPGKTWVQIVPANTGVEIEA